MIQTASSSRFVRCVVVISILILSACSDRASVQQSAETSMGASDTHSVERNPHRNAYFGDLHVHTQLSMDAYLFGTRASPDDAYRFAKGDALVHASGYAMQVKKPLDFLAVTDHATYLGIVKAMAEDQESALGKHPLAETARTISTPAESRAAFRALAEYAGSMVTGADESDPLQDRAVSADAWKQIIDSAERHNAPGTFTTFVGYEYTAGGPKGENLHRNVIFRSADVPDLPFGAIDSTNPEDLWLWMDHQRSLGRELLAIPHNSNGSDGLMFSLEKTDGTPVDAAYAATRMRNEPIVEQTQVKGTSDTHPLLSPNDEWADFEIMPIQVGNPNPSRPEGSYVRHALQRGIELADAEGFNPYQFGLIGSSDTHNAAGSFAEDNYWSKTSISDITPEQRGSVPLTGESEVGPGDLLASGESGVAPDGRVYAAAAARYWGASGLAGVWAEANTREDIYDALARKETFSTSGPHIRVRFFASQDYSRDLLDADDMVARAYELGEPMGGELRQASNRPLLFFAWAARDPDTVGLQRLQIIKSWMEHGVSNEQVYDIACADGGTVDSTTHRCPDNGATVDLGTCAPSTDRGASELRAVWEDPHFDPTQRAFYYVRVLENPKCRWSTWDAIRSGVVPRVDMQATIQDRAWSSPIWYTP